MPDSLPSRSCLAGLLLALAASSLGARDKPETPREVVLRLANEFRKSQKVSPLTVNEVLADTAQKHAENMARQDKYGDDGKNGHILDGKGMRDRIKESGYKGRIFGENVGMSPGRGAAKNIMAAWKKSSGHRKNLLNPNYTETGVGAARSKSGAWYFCHLFGAAGKRGEKPAGAVEISLSMENRTKEAFEVRTKGGTAAIVVEPGESATVKFSTTASNAVLEVKAKKKSAKAISLEVRDGGSYVIVAAGDKTKVEEKK
jgi:hypothetical protein